MKCRKYIAAIVSIGLALAVLLSNAWAAAAHANYVRSVPAADSASPVAPAIWDEKTCRSKLHPYSASRVMLRRIFGSAQRSLVLLR